MVILVSISAQAETITVITKETALRESCKFFSPVKATVHYNDPLEVLSQEGDWYRVKFKEVEGCVHKSAIEKKSALPKFIKAPFQSQSASGDEVALAGKGFNPQVEAAYKNKNPQLNFQAVDSIETYKVSDNSLREFITRGKLNPPK